MTTPQSPCTRSVLTVITTIIGTVIRLSAWGHKNRYCQGHKRDRYAVAYDSYDIWRPFVSDLMACTSVGLTNSRFEDFGVLDSFKNQIFFLLQINFSVWE